MNQTKSDILVAICQVRNIGKTNVCKQIDELMEKFPKTDFLLFPENHVSIIGPDVYKDKYVKEISKCVAKHQIYLFLTTYYLTAKSGHYICAVMFDRSGKIILVHAKKNQSGSLQGSDSGVVYLSEYQFNVGVLICLEIEHPDVLQAQLDKSVKMIFNPALIPHTQEMNGIKFVHARESLCDKLERVCVENGVSIIRSDGPSVSTSQILTPYCTCYVPRNGSTIFSQRMSIDGNDMQDALDLRKPYQERSYEKDNTGYRYRVYGCFDGRMIDGDIEILNKLRFVLLRVSRGIRVWDFNRHADIFTLKDEKLYLMNDGNKRLLCYARDGKKKNVQIVNVETRKWSEEFAINSENETFFAWKSRKIYSFGKPNIMIIRDEATLKSVKMVDLWSTDTEDFKKDEQIEQVVMMEGKKSGMEKIIVVTSCTKLIVYDVGKQKIEKMFEISEIGKLTNIKVNMQTQTECYVTIENQNSTKMFVISWDDPSKLVSVGEYDNGITDFVYFNGSRVIIVDERDFDLKLMQIESKNEEKKAGKMVERFVFVDQKMGDEKIQQVVYNGNRILFTRIVKKDGTGVIKMVKLARNRAKTTLDKIFN